MKAKNNNLKFTLKKFTVAKLNNLSAIKGGLGDITDNEPYTITNTSKNCDPNASVNI